MNFCFDEDWDVEELLIVFFEVDVVDVWDDLEDFDDDRNVLIFIFNENNYVWYFKSNYVWYFKMVDKCFLIVLYYGYVIWFYVFLIK